MVIKGKQSQKKQTLAQGNFSKDRGGHYMMMKGSVHQEDIVTPKCEWTKGQSWETREAETKMRKRRELDTSVNYSSRFQHSCLNKWQNNQAENSINYNSDCMEELNGTINRGRI